MSSHKIHEITEQDRRAVLSHFKRLHRRHNLAPERVRTALDHFRETRMGVLDFSHTAIGRRIFTSLHVWEMGGGTTSQFMAAERQLDRLLTIVAWGHGVSAESVRNLMHDETEAVCPSEKTLGKNHA